MHSRFPFRRQRLAAREQVVLGKHIERRQAGRAGQWVRRIGIAVEQFDHVGWALHEGLVDRRAGGDGRHWHGGVGQSLCHGHQVGHDAEIIGGERIAKAPEPGNDLIEDQQDAVGVANRANLLQVALGRHQHAG